MDPFSILSFVFALARTCVVLGPKLIKICNTWKNADRQVEQRILTLKNCWSQTQVKVELINRFASIIDTNALRTFYGVLDHLYATLEDAKSKLNTVIKTDWSSRPGPLSFGVKAKKAWWVWKKEAIDLTITDLEGWQRRFDPSHYLLMQFAKTVGHQRSSKLPRKPRALAARSPKTDRLDVRSPPPGPPHLRRFDRSPTNNATEQEAAKGEKWCKRHHLCHPIRSSQQFLNAMGEGSIKLLAPNSFQGTLDQVSLGVWKGSSYSGCPHTCIASSPPLYNASAHSPLVTWQKKTIYYEVNVLSDSRREVSLALGFNAPPYPSFRLPGWHRGSIAVHGDDGHKFVNDPWGGKSFTKPFKRRETLGIGIDLSPGQGGDITVEVFFTRNGTKVGRWDIHEETDPQYDQPLTGLEGFHDLCAAVGVFDAVSFEVVFAPNRWKWKGYQG